MKKYTIFKKNYSADAKTILVTSDTNSNADITFMNTDNATCQRKYE
jgi:hypothetical protein